MTQRILLDMDGVLADFVGGACQIHSRDNPYQDVCHNGRYDIASILKMSNTEFWQPMGKDFWANLPLTAEALDLVDLVVGYFGLENVCILSSPNLNHESMMGKLIWIERHLPQFRRQFLFGPRKQFCAAPNHVLIDDHDDNARNFTAAGGKGFLYPRPWNSAHHSGPREAFMSCYFFLKNLKSESDKREVIVEKAPEAYTRFMAKFGE